MKERGLIRIIILLSGALLWVAYLFDAVCSRYAIYEVIGYGAHELLSMLPYVSALATAVWLAITLVKGARGKTLRRELAFCGVLAPTAPPPPFWPRSQRRSLCRRRGCRR